MLEPPCVSTWRGYQLNDCDMETYRTCYELTIKTCMCGMKLLTMIFTKVFTSSFQRTFPYFGKYLTLLFVSAEQGA
jgi:hypothetical protein